jgi:hypothetical protein
MKEKKDNSLTRQEVEEQGLEREESRDVYLEGLLLAERFVMVEALKTAKPVQAPVAPLVKFAEENPEVTTRAD